MTNITELPEDCLQRILSLTSPRDVLRLSTVSKLFLAASKIDAVWREFLPSNWNNIVSLVSSPITENQFDSYKDVVVYLSCFPILLANNTTSFALDKWSGKTCYMLGSRALTISCGSRVDWEWETVTPSSFPECVVLEDMYRLYIKGKLPAAVLSPGTTYGVYFVFNFKFDSKHYECSPLVEVSISNKHGENVLMPQTKYFYLAPPPEPTDELEAMSSQTPRKEPPVVRSDGWSEIEMGRYRVGSDAESQSVVLKMTLEEVQDFKWRNMLIVHGIELRPIC